MINPTPAVNKQANYNAVRIQINDPKTRIPENYKTNPDNNGIYNGVDIQVNRPVVETFKKPIYSYPATDKIITYDMAAPALKLPLTYQTNLINNRTYIHNNNAYEVEFEIEHPEKETVNTGLHWNETTDKTQRGNVGLYQQNSSFTEDSSFIFLYYDNFYVNRSMSGEVRCFMRFILTSTLDRKINNLSVKLRWPEMETALNFYDVSPNVDTYFNYSLMGEGCYSMDKIPNIIVNRCRVAKMSAKECASKIRWLRKN